ncbi:Cardiolipin synthase [uncultured archaeon]|nr:Cardiolipin synthase [uncultured archaeon]
MSLPKSRSSGSISGKLFFVIVIIIAALIVFFAKGGEVIPEGGFNISPNDFNFLSADANSLGAQVADANVNSVEVFFCPQDACADKMIQHIDLAKDSIYVAIYSFTHDGIAQALVRAKERGVDVRVVFDYDQSKISASDDELLQAAGILIAFRNGPGYMHNKFMVIDNSIVATGSFNYSQNADTKNDENLVFIESAVVAQKFKTDFDHLWEVSNAA